MARALREINVSRPAIEQDFDPRQQQRLGDTGTHSSWRTSLGVLYPSVAGRGRWGLARQNPRLHLRVPLNVLGFCSCLDSLTGRGTCRELIRNNGATRKSDKNNRRAGDVGKRRKLVGEGNEGRAELNDRYVRCVS